MADNAQLASEAAKLLEDLRTLLEKGGQFVMEQAPPLAKEWIVWGRIWNTIESLCWACLVFVCARWFIVKYAAWKEDSGSYDFPAAPLAAGAVGLLSSMAFLYSMSYTTMAYFAPRLYLLKSLLNMAGSGCK